MRVPPLLPLTAAVVLALAAPAGAATVDDVDVIASGLDNPRHLDVGPSGDIYVAEAGRGGDFATSRSCFDTPEMVRACTGETGAVTRIARKHKGRHGGYEQRRIITGLASFATETGAGAEGPHGIFVDGHSLYVTNGGPTAPTRDGELVLRRPTLESEEPVSRYFGTLLKFRKHDRPRLLADIWKFERDNNPDRQTGNPEIDSNPVDVQSKHGRLVVADAGGNSLLKVDHRGKIRVLSLFPNVDTPAPGGGPIIPMNAVPTGVVAGPDGAYYVSQLTGFPFPVGGASVFRVDPRTGDFTTYATGFTNAMDLAFGRDGTLYVLEFDRDSLLAPGTDGGLWAVPPGGAPERIELPAGTLTQPGGIAVGRRGDLYVTNHAAEAGAGEVLKIELDD